MQGRKSLKNPNPNTSTSTAISAVPNSGKRKRLRSSENRPTGNDKNSNNSDFDDTSDHGKTRRAESNLNEDINGYSICSKHPPVLDDEADDAACKTNKGLKRLQQPPAYISVNLMKIKMECDYVPVVRLKQELVQAVSPVVVNSYDDHENEDEDEQLETDSPSFVCVQSNLCANNMNAESEAMNIERNLQASTSDCNGSEVVLNPHEPEIQYRSNCSTNFPVHTENSELKQQQQQEKVAETVMVKLVADASTSMETSENEMEKETVEILEERIQKYIQKVISLYRENMEIQTSLKSEMTQLKHVNNQLKGEIRDLNSSSIVQQNENKELKSQVAKQQQEIEKLKNKLKPRAKIKLAVENLNSNSKAVPNPEIQLSVENFDLETKTKSNTNSSSVQNGDSLTKVLSPIFDYLDINSLKKSRLVCRRWREEAGKILLKNFHLVCDEKERCESALINWLKNSNSSSKSTQATPFLKLFSENANRTLQVLQKFPTLSCSITDFKFSEKSATKILYEILLLLPNLKALETKTLDLSPQQKWLGFVKSPNKLDLLVRKLKTLNRLKLDYGMTKVLARQFFLHGQQFASIKKLELHATGSVFMAEFLRNSWHNWRITRFTLNVHGYHDVGVIRSFLLEISVHLQQFKLILLGSQERLLSPSMSSSSSSSSSRFQPWTDNWIIPLGLTKVETLEIERAFGKQTFVVKCLVAALRLPRLKKLAIDDVLFGKELQEEVDKWNSHESARGRNLSSNSLEDLEVVPQFAVISQCHQSKIPGHPWPGLKSLKCSWNSSEPFDASFLSELRNLERLELTILKWTPKGPETNEKNYSESSTKFQLRDLNNLKSLRLKFSENGKRYQNFANSLIKEDLKFMRRLQCVQFLGIIVDAEPLKSALGPNVPIIFTY